MSTEDIIAKALRPEVQAKATAGMAAVINAKGELEALGFGHPAPGSDEPLSANAVFRIASMSKSFLAALAHVLHDEGVIDLHRPVDEVLPEFRLLWNGTPASVSVHDLLSNRAGLPEDNAWGDRNIGMSRDDFAAMCAAGLQLAAAPGTIYQYSNIGQAIAGAVIEEQTGETVDDLVRELFIEPLGLTHTAYRPEELPADAVVIGGMRTFDDGKTFTPEPFVGAGALSCIAGLFSTIIDVSVWMRYLSAGFERPDARPQRLTQESRREMQSAHTVIPLTVEQSQRLSGLGYAHGLVVEQHRRFGRIVQHSGGLPGFSSHMRWHPASGTSVVVFGNSDSFGAGDRAREILDSVLAEQEVTDAAALWPPSLAAAERVDDIVCGGRSFDELAEFAADNLLRDVPAADRQRKLDELVAEVGAVAASQKPFSERMRSTGNAAEVQWQIACENGSLTCTARMTPHFEPLLQSVAIVKTAKTS